MIDLWLYTTLSGMLTAFYYWHIAFWEENIRHDAPPYIFIGMMIGFFSMVPVLGTFIVVVAIIYAEHLRYTRNYPVDKPSE